MFYTLSLSNYTNYDYFDPYQKQKDKLMANIVL